MLVRKYVHSRVRSTPFALPWQALLNTSMAKGWANLLKHFREMLVLFSALVQNLLQNKEVSEKALSFSYSKHSV